MMLPAPTPEEKADTAINIWATRTGNEVSIEGMSYADALISMIEENAPELGIIQGKEKWEKLWWNCF